MWCEDASTSGDCLARRIESACGGSRDGNRWSAYRRALSQVFLLKRVIELPRAFVRQSVHPLTATTFGDWLSPRAQAHYHKFRISTVGSNYNSFLVRLWWNLDYSTKGSSHRSKGEAPVFFHLRHIFCTLHFIHAFSLFIHLITSTASIYLAYPFIPQHFSISYSYPFSLHFAHFRPLVATSLACSLYVKSSSILSFCWIVSRVISFSWMLSANTLFIHSLNDE